MDKFLKICGVYSKSRFISIASPFDTETLISVPGYPHDVDIETIDHTNLLSNIMNIEKGSFEIVYKGAYRVSSFTFFLHNFVLTECTVFYSSINVLPILIRTDGFYLREIRLISTVSTIYLQAELTDQHLGGNSTQGR